MESLKLELVSKANEQQAALDRELQLLKVQQSALAVEKEEVEQARKELEEEKANMNKLNIAPNDLVSLNFGGEGKATVKRKSKTKRKKKTKKYQKKFLEFLYYFGGEGKATVKRSLLLQFENSISLQTKIK